MERGFKEILIFEIARQRYGLLSSDVREVVRAVTIATLPKAPAIVEGVINVRGTAVAVLDIRARFRLPSKNLEPQDQLILAAAGERLVALRVDRALDLSRIDENEIQDAKRTVPGSEYIAGVAKLPDGLVLIHDLATFLSQAESETLAGSLSEQDRQSGGR